MGELGVEALSFLAGTWAGEGEEEYPTVDPARYLEELRFEVDAAGFLAYRQRAWHPEDGATLHSESGFWRLAPGGTLEVALAHPLGVVEVSEGRVAGGEISLATRVVGRTATGEPVGALERRYLVEGDRMTYEIALALDHVPLTHHLRAALERVPAEHG